MKLLLTSNGIHVSFESEFLSLLEKDPKDITAAFITTAAFGEEDNPTWLPEYKGHLQRYGITNIKDLNIKDKSRAELEKILVNKDIIFVNGGNTFYLLKYVKESGFDKIVKNLIDKGVLYIGVSAGSIITCPTIESAEFEPADENKVGLKDLTALNIVPYLISPHFEENHQPVLENKAKTAKYPIIALKDTQALLFNNNYYRIVGEGEKLIFNKSQYLL